MFRKIIYSITFFSFFLLLLLIWDISYSYSLTGLATEKTKIAKESNNEWAYYDAIIANERVIFFYFPFSPWYKKAQDNLSTLGISLEKHGKIKLAKRAWLAKKAGIMISRSIYQPYKKEIILTDQHIGKLFNDKNRLKRKHINDPNIFFSIFMLLGLIMWISSVILFIINKNKIVTKFVIFITGYGLWVISIYFLN